MMNQYLIQHVYLILNDKVELKFFHHKHLEMHQVQEESKIIFLYFKNKIKKLTTIASFRL